MKDDLYLYGKLNKVVTPIYLSGRKIDSIAIEQGESVSVLPINDEKRATLNIDTETLTKSEIDGKVVIGVNEDYISKIVYNEPVLTLSVENTNTDVEYGAGYTTRFFHLEQNPANITTSSLTLQQSTDNEQWTSVREGISPSPRETLITNYTASIDSLTSSIYYRLTATSTNNTTLYSNVIRVGTYMPVFFQQSSAETLETVSQLAKLADFPSSKTFTVVVPSYVYMLTTGGVIDVKSDGIVVPVTQLDAKQVTINNQSVDYNVFRTSYQLLVGEHTFTFH